MVKVELTVWKTLLGFSNKLVGVVPVLQQIGGFFVVHSNVVVFKHPREKVVNLSGHVQYVSHSTEKSGAGDRLKK